MRKHRCPGGVKVARFPGMSEVFGSNMPGKSATFTPSGHLCFLMHYPTISTHR